MYYFSCNIIVKKVNRENDKIAFKKSNKVMKEFSAIIYKFIQLLGKVLIFNYFL